MSQSQSRLRSKEENTTDIQLHSNDSQFFNLEDFEDYYLRIYNKEIDIE